MRRFGKAGGLEEAQGCCAEGDARWGLFIRRIVRIKHQSFGLAFIHLETDRFLNLQATLCSSVAVVPILKTDRSFDMMLNCSPAAQDTSVNIG